MKQYKDLCQLLPWYVNGTLDTKSMKRMNEHLDNCERCASDFEISMQFSRSLQQPPRGVDTILNQQESGLAKLKQRIEQDDHSEQSTGTFSESIALFMQRLWGNYQWVFSATGGAAFAMAFFLLNPTILNEPSFNQSSNDHEEFNLLSNNVNVEYPVIQIIFEPDTTEKQIRELMIKQKVEFLGGPTATGVYRLKIGQDQNVHDYAEALSSKPYIRWAASE